MPHKLQERLPGLLLILILLLTLSIFHPYPYDNVITRWALTAQLVERGSIQIDPYAELTNDRAYNGGHYYCDKAVMTSLAAVIVYAPVRLISGVLGMGISDAAFRYLAERIITVGSLIILLVILLRYSRRKGYDSLLPLLALGAGSILLPYSTLLYGHVPAAFMLFLSYYFQDREKYALADLAGSVAVALEFPVMISFLILIVYRRKGYWNFMRLLRIPAFLILAMTPQFIHNTIAFGSPLTMGYSLETADAFQGMSRGLFGFTFPSLKSLYLLVISPERGLFFYMPWTVLGIMGFFHGRKFLDVIRNDPLPLITVAYILLFSAYYMPSGGWAFGPRHLIPIVPFLAIGLMKYLKNDSKRKCIALFMTIPAIFLSIIGTLGEIHQPVHPVEQPVPIPQFTIGLRMMLDGHHSMWLPGGPVCMILAGALLAVPIFIMIREARFTLLGPIFLVLWASLMLLSNPGRWGGKIDYYRGVLAEQRHEWRLAAMYYGRAANDPTAPDIVGERAEYCREMERAEL